MHVKGFDPKNLSSFLSDVDAKKIWMFLEAYLGRFSVAEEE